MTATSLVAVIAPMMAEPGIVPTNKDCPQISPRDKKLDEVDEFNKPRLRRTLILTSLSARSENIVFLTPQSREDSLLSLYASVHSKGLLTFFMTAWSQWEALGSDGQNPDACLKLQDGRLTPYLIPSSVPLPRDPHQRSSMNVMGQMGYYCTDNCTPITDVLLDELKMDATILQDAVETAMQGDYHAVYALPTHPGHHAARDSFGGYCYLNQAAFAAKLFQSNHKLSRVAILDIDYHCGNGTASIFYDDPSVLVVSLHCDPNMEYPFHSGFTDQVGIDDGIGTTCHFPMPPKTQWDGNYQKTLLLGLHKIQEFHAEALVISMGLDTHENDPCAIRRAGFCLQGNDYYKLGRLISRELTKLPTVIIQEGGYRLDTIGDAATNVIMGFLNDALSRNEC